MQIARKSGTDRKPVLTAGHAIVVFLILAIVTGNTVAILSVLGTFTLWESAVAIFAVLVLAAGAFGTVLLIPRMVSGQADQGGAFKKPLSRARGTG